VVALCQGVIGRYGSDWLYLPAVTGHGRIGQRANDDVMWMVIAFARAAAMSGDKTYLDAAAQNFDGVYASYGLDSAAIINGTIRTWPRYGVNLAENSEGNCRVAGVLTGSNRAGGIYGGVGCTVTNCLAYFNNGTGISTLEGSIVSGCTAVGNGGVGIAVTQGATVVDCTVIVNTLGGIQGATNNLIRGNACSFSSGGAGIQVTGLGNRIEGNHCGTNRTGLDAESSGNIIIRNTCSGNATNWKVVAGNALAPIVWAATNVGAVNGNAYAGNLGTTDPNANFTH